MARRFRKPIAHFKLHCASLVCALALTPFAARAQNRNVEYICVADMVSGLSYDSGMKKWKAMTFPIERKFNLRLRFLSAKATKEFFGKDDVETKYEVEVKMSAEKTPSPCLDLRREFT